ncbi:ankyrin repeat domain-containing protein [Chitinophaga nivalis]|uniref:Ankyrin repeat domain-containing protein n=1 Tax=Chitinophaga nivalis TaxID=2991709 RepID=A0ABT3IMQ8_9BACT|nr:ankyrin repeat domain-containing protein [Chitinophaga nivalis]MCW3465051.1 ankyrin repeat domain-containing protein [Chitinophaga nivalis]MCW3485257.1 ankyrin repeat domain-containing protein [Chitinophaga nivalis]
MYEVNKLADAIRRRNMADVRQLITQGEKLPKQLPDFDKKQIFDSLLLTKAFDLVDELLIKEGLIVMDIYEYDKFDGSIFESLFRTLGTTPEELDFLTSFVARLDNINDALQDKTLLRVAFNQSAPMEQIRILVAAGCDIHYKTNYEENFLYKIVQEFAIKEDIGLAYLSFLIGEGLDPNAGNIVGTTPLHLAVGSSKSRYIDLLLENGADPNQPNKDGETPFYNAIVHQVCDIQLYEKLLRYAAPDFEGLNKNKEPLFVGAVRMRRRGSEYETAVIQALLRDGADIYQTAPYYSKDKSALDWISEYPAEVLQTVLEAGVVDLERRDDEGNTILHKVCAYNVNYEQEAAKQLYRKVKLLIENGAAVNVTNDQDKSPLDLAAQDNLKAKTVELLLKHKS